jgi:hypothetical protein
VNGGLEGIGVDVQTDPFAVDFFVQRGIAMASKTFVIGWFLDGLFGRISESGGEKQHRQKRNHQPASSTPESTSERLVGLHARLTSQSVPASPLLGFSGPTGYESSHGGT